MVFPVQQPTAANFEVWRWTLYNISSPALRLDVRLGWLRRLPYDRVLWRVSRDRSVVVLVDIPGARFPHYFYHPPPTQLAKAVATLAHSVPFLPMLHYTLSGFGPYQLRWLHLDSLGYAGPNCG
jgi:hypothetical protein